MKEKLSLAQELSTEVTTLLDADGPCSSTAAHTSPPPKRQKTYAQAAKAPATASPTRVQPARRPSSLPPKPSTLPSQLTRSDLENFFAANSEWKFDDASRRSLYRASPDVQYYTVALAKFPTTTYNGSGALESRVKWVRKYLSPGERNNMPEGLVRRLNELRQERLDVALARTAKPLTASPPTEQTEAAWVDVD